MPEKRKLPSLGLSRRVKARKADAWDSHEDDNAAADDSDAPSEQTNGDLDDTLNGDEESPSEAGSDDEDQSSSESNHDETPKVDLSSISFGALAKAQAALPQSSRKPRDDADPAQALEGKGGRLPRAQREKSSTTKRSKPPTRVSKHAPQEQTSKKPVSRRREILADPRRQYRDPRFDALSSVSQGNTYDEAKVLKHYSFLDDYRESEMAELRVKIKKAKDPSQKENLKRELHSMESKKKAKVRKDEQDNLLKEHRQHEKELVAQGKQPFYLKKSEQKKRLLTDRFKGMSKGQVDRAIERKRKKVAGKEKKELGSMQRVKDRR